MSVTLVLSDLDRSVPEFINVAVSSGEEEVVDCSFCLVAADREGDEQQL